MKKFGMVPDHSLFQALATCLVAILPKGFYERLDERSIVLKRSKTFSFSREGVVVDGEVLSSLVNSDVVIYATGFRGDLKIMDMFTSEYFRSVAVGSACTTVPLYR